MPSSSGLRTWPWTRARPSRSSRRPRSTITPEQAFEVTERTEGWPVGLHLAAMIARDAPHGSWDVSGDDRYVADYLHQEALSKSDPRCSGSSAAPPCSTGCTVRCATRSLGESGAQERLEALEASNSFLIPLDRQPGVVPLPPAVPGVPARRAPAVRSRPDREAARARRGLVRGATAPRPWPSSTC